MGPAGRWGRWITQDLAGHGKDFGFYSSRDGIPGIPWQSSGWESAFPLQGAWVPSLVELRSHKMCDAAKKRWGEESIGGF